MYKAVAQLLPSRRHVLYMCISAVTTWQVLSVYTREPEPPPAVLPTYTYDEEGCESPAYPCSLVDEYVPERRTEYYEPEEPVRVYSNRGWEYE
jgi:hypothetical protein